MQSTLTVTVVVVALYVILNPAEARRWAVPGTLITYRTRWKRELSLKGVSRLGVRLFEPRTDAERTVALEG